MIVPVAFSLVREETVEQFSTLRELDRVGPYTKLKFSVDLLDVASGNGRGVSGLLLVDAEEKDPFRAMGSQRIFHGTSDAHKDYLRRLRDEINKVIGED